ncbi:sulfate ABC transporter substrate-binding protein [Paracoccus sanguinis]|uniref:Sulfate ABC transporter substrate-binding protein n=1 Tax=Paracoccus sanguinis TaxID=1545044 RepID=A0A099GGT0_9RHOB|nr:sulfate ABC transporter substrate-binding protein [Paracoccus sanguinis]KGJ21101.1 sulfate ABC transporter substrate-binding protein [Paracoccus sanguinis]KGJ21921.1 sulfate ABC transporter substrate-binding protein [Paracoccus sanguinis]
MDLSRRSFLRLAGAGVAATSLGAMGFGTAEAAELAHVRDFKLAAMTETRNTCPYCSVACGIIVYAAPGEDGKRRVMHIEGDADHPVNRGTLCPKGAALKDFVNAETRLTQPMIRKPGATAFEPISWDDALDRIARAMKDDRDANLLQTNEAGVPVNRWTTTGFLAASATTNETAWLTYKVVRSMGIVGFDNQARV